MTQANDSARSLRTLASSASALSKAVLEVAADRLDALQSENDELREDVIRCGENWKELYCILKIRLQKITEAWNAEIKSKEDSVFVGSVHFETHREE